MKLNLKIIMNPSSGRETATTMVSNVLDALLQNKAIHSVNFFYTTKGNDAWLEASKLKTKEFDIVLAVGGDGTINEVVNGLLESQSKIPLAILPTGTVNDFACYLEMPTDGAEYAQMLMDLNLFTIDVGKIGERFFLNVLGGGLLTSVAHNVPVEAKTVLGRGAYWIEGLKDLSSNFLQSKFLRFTYKEGTEYKVIEENVLLFMVANTTQVGGFKKLIPYAEVCDGLLDVLIIKKLDFGEIVPLFGTYIVNNHINNKNIIYFQTDQLHIDLIHDDILQLDLDGEAGQMLPATIQCMHEALEIVVPAKSFALKRKN